MRDFHSAARTPALPLVGFSIGMKRECQQNESLVVGWLECVLGSAAPPGSTTHQEAGEGLSDALRAVEVGVEQASRPATAVGVEADA